MTTQPLEGLAAGTATISDDGRYRYRLTRRWADRGAAGDGLLWVMLNPSTADADRNDATLRRCLGFSRDWGFASLTVVNLYALISTDPAGLWKAEDPVGPDNDAMIALAAQEAQAIVVAWGNNAPHPGRTRTVIDILRANSFYAQRLHCLGKTAEDHPRHPVRLPAATPMEVFLG